MKGRRHSAGRTHAARRRRAVMGSEPQRLSECARAVAAFASLAPSARFTTEDDAGIILSLFPGGFSLRQCAAGLEECKARSLIKDPGMADALATAASVVAEDFAVPVRELFERSFPSRKYHGTREAMNALLTLPLVGIKMPCTAAEGTVRYVMFERNQDTRSFAAGVRRLCPTPELAQRMPKEALRLLLRLAHSMVGRCSLKRLEPTIPKVESAPGFSAEDRI
jgi:hypothetical protein